MSDIVSRLIEISEAPAQKTDFDAWPRMNTALAFIDCVWTSLDALAQRLAAILRLHPTLDDLYDRACLDCFIAEELGL
jgi:hypothetical protein